MNISLIQADLHWEDRDLNLKMLDSKLEQIQETDLIVLPEMFSTAFSIRSEDLSESMEGPSVQWMKEKAKEKDAALCGSLMIQEDGLYFNRLIFAEPNGQLQHYNKRHLFRMAAEAEHFTSGSERVITLFRGWKIMLQVCYDLRFPVFTRNRYVGGDYEYDLVLYVANWPKPRHNAWETLLRARATENLSYCAGVNRIGEDGNGLSYRGGSAIIDYLGNSIQEAQSDPCIIQSELNKEALKEFRNRFPTGLDADSFELSL